MNRPPETSVNVREERLLSFASACFEKAGSPPAQARAVARLLVDSDLRGVRSHGCRALDGYCASLEAGLLNPAPRASVIHETPAVAALDGDGGLGYVPMLEATDMAVARARELGLGMATVRSIGHYGSAGHYCRRAAAAGCIGFSAQGPGGLGNAAGADPKPQLAYYGNPPICFALPGGETPGVVLDAATRILADYQKGPEFDALIPVIPAAFFKSVGYTAVAALMGGGLAGITQTDPATAERWPKATSGGTILAIHVGSAVSEEAFRAEVDRMVRDVAATYEPFPGHDRALLPGAVEAERFERYRREGIPFGPPEQESVRGAGARLGVPLPWDEE